MSTVSSSFRSIIASPFEFINAFQLVVPDEDVVGFHRITQLEKVVRLCEEAIARFLGVSHTEVRDCLR